MIITGNNSEILRTYADNHFDAVVTDPPYGLSFMGKKWDYDVPSVELWKEVLRVLKPGGHILCACGTRTQHRMAVNIEDAGFEIRDIITWHYGSGFPKSLDISKAIDNKAGAEREVIGSKGLNNYNPVGMEHTVTYRSQNFEKADQLTAPATDAAKQWNGFGTALKPATELWTLARKPLSCNTIAENVLKYGTGGLNIDGCRILLNGEQPPTGSAKRIYKSNGYTEDKVYGENKETSSLGRFPANLVFSCDCEGQHEDGCPVGELDKQSGNLSTCGGPKTTTHNTGMFGIGTPGKIYSDTGGASRFFYVAKASKSERNKGLEGFEKIDSPFGDNREDGNGLGMKGKQTAARQNFHPTVKPVTLMRYLCRLITPPKGIILDPFNGSGTTGIAAKLEWFEYVGIEKEHDYSKISEARQPPPDLFT